MLRPTQLRPVFTAKDSFSKQLKAAYFKQGGSTCMKNWQWLERMLAHAVKAKSQCTPPAAGGTMGMPAFLGSVHAFSGATQIQVLHSLHKTDMTPGVSVLPGGTTSMTLLRGEGASQTLPSWQLYNGSAPASSNSRAISNCLQCMALHAQGESHT